MMNRIIVIGGPTASGKTALAIRCAKFLDTEIISADSRQCYTEMNIGTAKPGADELAQVKHHFINSHQLPFKVNAGEFTAYANPVLQRLLHEKGAAIVAGGTGLYIRALLEGLDLFPEIPEEVREKLNLEATQPGSLPSHQRELEEKDPEWYEKIDIRNQRRILRALEVIRSSGRPYSSFLTSKKMQWDAKIEYYFPDPDRNELYRKIETRVDEMMASGLEKEVFSLREWEHHPALQTVGYREFFPFFRGEYDLGSAVKLIKQHTRNYAKRQWTWFRNQGDWKALDTRSEEFLNGRISA